MTTSTGFVTVTQYGANGFEIMQAGCIDDIRAGVFELLESFDGVVEIPAAPEEVLAEGPKAR
jgi:hypothetical protein